MRWVKPIDKAQIVKLCNSHKLLVTIEENAIAGGAGSAVSEYLSEQNLNANLLQLGLDDTFPNHGKPDALRHAQQLDEEGIITAINQRLAIQSSDNVTQITR